MTMLAGRGPIGCWERRQLDGTRKVICPRLLRGWRKWRDVWAKQRSVAQKNPSLGKASVMFCTTGCLRGVSFQGPIGKNP